jgi:hypothetical protein
VSENLEKISWRWLDWDQSYNNKKQYKPFEAFGRSLGNAWFCLCSSSLIIQPSLYYDEIIIKILIVPWIQSVSDYKPSHSNDDENIQYLLEDGKAIKITISFILFIYDYSFFQIGIVIDEQNLSTV